MCVRVVDVIFKDRRQCRDGNPAGTNSLLRKLETDGAVEQALT
jgi:hypothetical protein